MGGRIATMTMKNSSHHNVFKNGNSIPSSPNDKQSTATTTMSSNEAKAILDNYDMETMDRRAQLESQIQSALATLRNKCEREIAKIASVLVLDSMTAYEFVNVHGCSVAAALKAVQAGGENSRLSKETHTAQAVEEEKEEIGRTIRKRKRLATNNTDANSTADDTANAASPTKPRKNMRVAPPSPSSRTATTGLGITSTSSKARVPSSSNKRVPSTTSSSRMSTSNAANFVYRARPSVVPLALNPRLPQTPQVRNASFGGNTIMQSKTARRLPKRNESIQAYSMNGSPLGILDLAVEAGSSKPPTSSATSASASETEEDWEILQRHSSSQQQPPSSSSRLSPQKLGRKGSTIASSAFKAAIISGASKFTSTSSSRHHPHSQQTSLNSPTKAKFTIQAPGIDSNKSRLDWENWTTRFRKEMEGMDMSADDKRRLEGRLKEMMMTGPRG